MNERSIFIAALEREDEAERAAYLEQACGGDQAARQRIERLLTAHAAAGGILDQPVVEPSPTVVFQPISEGPGTVLGPYKLREQIGEGGFGVVYVAEQEKPIRRKVALKIIKPGMDTRDVIARFEAERQALAMMDHPNVARVVDAGATDSGRPYFVMELVQGVPITEFCDKNNLPTRERLCLFADVCRAVQHAHQKGIIHRDIKPSNILVTLHDGKPVPKVIDFGVSKALSQQLTEKSIYTAYGQMIGTPSYMSPEQAEMSGLGIDTRSDIYSLGVLLYELLTGTTPLDAKRLREGGYAEMLRIIREEEPPRPSLKISTLGEAATVIAGHRHTDPRQLGRALRGELDWIVMKCLEKDRNRRYETSNNLARDIERYLHDEPVEACPPSAAYRLRKLLRKHRAGVLTATALLAVLVLGVVASTWQAVRAKRAELEALAAREQESQQRQQMEDQRNRAVEAEQVARANEQKARDEEQKARDSILEMMTLLSVFQNQVADVTAAYKASGKLDQAVSFYQQAAEAVKAQLGPEDNSTQVSLANLAMAYRTAGKMDQAIALFEQALPVLQAGPGPDHPITLFMTTSLAEAYNDVRQPDRAIVLFEQTIPAWTAILGSTDDYTLTAKNNLGFAYMLAGKLDKAIPLLQEVLTVRETRYTRNHLHTLTSMKNLAAAYQKGGRFDQAIALFEQTLAARKARFGPDHPSTLTSMGDLARALQASGKLQQAVPLFEQALAGWTSSDGLDDPDTHIARHDLALAYRDIGRLRDALPLLEQAASAFKKQYGITNSQWRLFQRSLADLHERLGQAEAAEPLRRELAAASRANTEADSLVYAYELVLLALNLEKQEKHAEAESLLRECQTIREQKRPGDWSTFYTRSLLGGSLLGQKRYADAEPLLLSGYDGMKKCAAKIRRQDKPRLTEALERLVQLYEATGKKDEAAKWRKELQAAKTATSAAEKP